MEKKVQNKFFLNTYKVLSLIYIYVLATIAFSVGIVTIILPNYSMDILAFNSLLLFVFWTLFLPYYFIYSYYNESFVHFSNKLIFFGFIYCVPYIFLQYYLSYTLIPDIAPMSVGISDDREYLRWSLFIEKVIDGELSWNNADIDIDDRGFPTWIALLYHVFGHSDLAIKLFNALFVGLGGSMLARAVILIRGDENTAKISGLLYCFMPTIAYLSGYMLKETLMFFLLVGSIYGSVKLYHKISISNILLIVFFTTLLFFFRTFLGVLVICLALAYISSRNMKRFIIVLIVSLPILFISGASIILENEKISSGINGLQGTGWFYKKNNATGILDSFGGVVGLAPFSPIMPPPSVLDLKSHIDKSNVAMMYRIHVDLVRMVLMFFFYLSIYYIYRHKQWSRYSLFILGALVIILVNTKVGVLTYYRYQSTSLMYFIPLMAYGIKHFTDDYRKNRMLFSIYITFIIMFVIIYNFYRFSLYK